MYWLAILTAIVLVQLAWTIFVAVPLSDLICSAPDIEDQCLTRQELSDDGRRNLEQGWDRIQTKSSKCSGRHGGTLEDELRTIAEQLARIAEALERPIRVGDHHVVMDPTLTTKGGRRGMILDVANLRGRPGAPMVRRWLKKHPEIDQRACAFKFTHRPRRRNDGSHPIRIEAYFKTVSGKWARMTIFDVRKGNPVEVIEPKEEGDGEAEEE
jgi:hypothetical protein